MTEPAALHVVVSYFDHEFGAERLPRKIFALAPATLAAGHALPGFSDRRTVLGPLLPRMAGQCILAVGREDLCVLVAIISLVACSHDYVFERSIFIE
jgi:hypothetical protein